MISRRSGLALVAPLALALTAFFLLPILLLVPMSFEKYAPGSGIIKGAWTLSNYTQLVTDDYYREVIGRTLGLGFAVTFACLALGYPLAYLIARGPERWRVPLTLLVIFPMMLNLVVRSFGWIDVPPTGSTNFRVDGCRAAEPQQTRPRRRKMEPHRIARSLLSP